MRAPLAGTRVIELGHIVAGPTAGLLLAEMGAEVIKVESPGGDQARAMPGQSRGIFPFLNRSKASVCLSLRAESAGRRVLTHMLERTDVLIVNYAPDTVAQLGLDWAALSRRAPHVVAAYLQGYLPGPNGDQPLLDEMAQMSSGLAYMTGPPGRPLRAGASIIDMGAATYLCLGILAALLERHRTGAGGPVYAGLFETAAFWVGQHVAGAAVTRTEPQPYPARASGARMGWGIYDVFRSRDGRALFVGITSDRQWRRFTAHFGRTDWAADTRLATNALRVAQRGWLVDAVAGMFAAMDGEDLVRTLQLLRLPFAPLRTPAELAEDEHLRLSGGLVMVAAPGGETVPAVRPPFVVGERRPEPPPGPPPALGADTMSVLAALGVPEELRLAAVREAAVGTDAGAGRR